MKKSLRDILSSADSTELDVLLDGFDESAPKISSVNRIKVKALKKSGIKRNVFLGGTKKRIAAFAAGVLIFSAVGFGGYAYAADVRQYNEAVSFFDEHELSRDGLSRAEIKAVYRDITTESFKYPKTAEVIAKSISGYELDQSDPTPEDVEALWNYKNYNGRYWVSDSAAKEKVVYRHYGEDKMDEELGFLVFDRSYFEKYENDQLIWSVSFEEFYIDDYITVDGGAVVYGHSSRISTEQESYAYMSLVSDSGEILWLIKLENGFHSEYICKILDNRDGTLAVFSRGDLEVFCLSQYDKNGDRLSFDKTEIGNYGIWNAAHFGDGYIVQLGSYNTGEMAKIVKVDKNGKITETFSYSGDDCYYYITDMIEFCGNIYLSAYAIPKGEDDEHSKVGHYEMKDVFDKIAGKYNISSEALTPMVRDNYTAMLLVCEPSTGTPTEFYSVGGSLGGEITIDENGRLLWDVESITSVSFSPMTSAYSFKGSSYIYRYTFDEKGMLVNREKTGEITDFIR